MLPLPFRLALLTAVSISLCGCSNEPPKSTTPPFKEPAKQAEPPKDKKIEFK